MFCCHIGRPEKDHMGVLVFCCYTGGRGGSLEFSFVVDSCYTEASF